MSTRLRRAAALALLAVALTSCLNEIDSGGDPAATRSQGTGQAATIGTARVTISGTESATIDLSQLAGSSLVEGNQITRSWVGARGRSALFVTQPRELTSGTWPTSTLRPVALHIGGEGFESTNGECTVTEAAQGDGLRGTIECADVAVGPDGYRVAVTFESTTTQ